MGKAYGLQAYGLPLTAYGLRPAADRLPLTAYRQTVLDLIACEALRRALSVGGRR
jgi:hypothetical protein